MIELYLKTALGLEKDAAYLEYTAATARHRQKAFTSFILCAALFSVGFVLDLFVRLRSTPMMQTAFTMLGLVACVSIGLRLNDLMVLAAAIIFKAPVPPQ